MEYLKEKRKKVLDTIKPICEVFGVNDYDYITQETGQKEVLRIEDTLIACTSNSISAIIDEIIGYIFINIWCRHRSLGAFSTQVKKQIKKYWLT